jgi:hypothetical protein
VRSASLRFPTRRQAATLIVGAVEASAWAATLNGSLPFGGCQSGSDRVSFV